MTEHIPVEGNDNAEAIELDVSRVDLGDTEAMLDATDPRNATHERAERPYIAPVKPANDTGGREPSVINQERMGEHGVLRYKKKTYN